MKLSPIVYCEASTSLLSKKFEIWISMIPKKKTQFT